MFGLVIEESRSFLKGCGAHFSRRALLYRRLSQFLAFVSAVAIIVNVLFQFDAMQRVNAAGLSVTPVPAFGIYYDSREIRVGQMVSIKEVVSYLRDIGYSEVKTSSGNFAPGSFQITPSGLLRLRSDFPGIPSDLSIEWSKGKISRIVAADGNESSSAKLEPKPINNLVPKLENEEDAQFAVNFPVLRYAVRNGELENSVVKSVLCSAEGKCDLPFSVSGAVRAANNNFIVNPDRERRGLPKGNRQGGSTPIMQIYKNISGDSRDSYFRKITEVYVASDLARRMTAPVAFELWVNHIYFGVSKRGQNLYGLQTAAVEIFGKNAKDLTLSEATFLAALTPSPYLLPKLWSRKYNDAAWKIVKNRQAAILKNMLKKNPDRFTAAQIESAKQKKIVFAWDAAKPKAAPLDSLNAPIRQLIADEFSAFHNKQKTENLVIPFGQLRSVRGETRIDEKLQRAGQKILNEQLPVFQKKFPPIDKNGKPARDSLIGVIAVSDTETGEIIALIATATDHRLEISKMYVNLGVAPCSQKKPFDYACAFEDGKITLLKRFDPRECKIKRINSEDWQPGVGVGDHVRSIAEGLAASDDGMVTCVVSEIGLERSVEFYGAATGNFAKPLVSPFGETEFPAVITTGFGRGLETSVLDFLETYPAFVRGGRKQKVHLLSRVYRGDKVILPPNENQEQIFSEETAYLVFWAMRGAVGVGPFGSYGTATNLDFSRYLQKHPEIQMGCKTGSGPHNVGITCVAPRFSVSTQLYYAKHSRFRQIGEADIYAASTSGLIWSKFMMEALKIKPEIFAGEVPRPAGIIEVKVDLQRGCRTESGIPIPFKTGTEPEFCSEVIEEPNSRQNFVVVDTRDDSDLNLREGKDLKSSSVAIVPEGEQVTLLFCEAEKVIVNEREGRWCRVEYQGIQGWAWGWFLREILE